VEANPASAYGDDINSEPEGEPDTLAHPGPLASMVGIREGARGDRNTRLRIGAPTPNPPAVTAP